MAGPLWRCHARYYTGISPIAVTFSRGAERAVTGS